MARATLLREVSLLLGLTAAMVVGSAAPAQIVSIGKPDLLSPNSSLSAADPAALDMPALALAAASQSSPSSPVADSMDPSADSPSRAQTSTPTSQPATTAPATQPAATFTLPPQECQPLFGSGPHDSGNPNTLNSPTDPGSWLLQTLTALGVVILLMVFVRSIARRASGGKLRQAGAGALVEVLARTPMGNKTQIVFLRINQKVIVASQTPGSLTALATIDDPQEVSWLLGKVQQGKPGSITKSFKQVLTHMDRTYNGTVANPEEGGDTSEQFVDRAQEQVQALMERLRQLNARMA